MSGITDLIAALRDPAILTTLDGPRWTALLSVAKAEVLLGTLAAKAEDLDLPPAVAGVLAAQRAATAVAHTRALWEADRARAALAPLGLTPILLKGTAYVAAGLTAGQGRQIGDLDILVPQGRLDEVEAALLASGWQWLKPDPYDDAYYRRWMHELPPLIHREREAMIDVHHTILPLTHRATPDAAAMVADAVPLPSWGGAVRLGSLLPSRSGVGSPASGPPLPPPASGRGTVATLSPPDRIIHCAAHLLADGELDGGLRNLWDMHCLLSEATDWEGLAARAAHHQLLPPTQRAARLASDMFGTIIPKHWDHWDRQDKWYRQRLLARDDWGRPSLRFIRFCFYLRSHGLRMPPLLLARHLWIKWRRT
jgi:hypothetical protein